MGDTVKREKQLEEANTSADLRKNNKVAVVLPVYKTEMDMSEQASFEQCLKVLGGYDIFLVTHAQLNTDFYEKIARKQGTKLSYAYFDKAFFRNIRGYNSLMLSIDFYRQFERYSHILIHQLDAFVFRNELPYWTSLPYDYVGAPWFGEFRSHEEGGVLWAVGNGGLSLRRTEYFIDLLQRRLPNTRMPLRWLFNPFDHRKFFYMLHRRGTIGFYAKQGRIDEDFFFTEFLNHTSLFPNVPKPELAMRFAFKKSPSYLFEKNKRELPFGCHAFMRYEYSSFWSKYIKLNRD